jgi:hypothetical protein
LLTFDDGWKSGLNAVPVLEKYNFKAVFFIFPGKGIGQPYMGWNDVLALAENPRFEICSHTLTHPWDRQSNLVSWIEGRTTGKDKRDVEYELKESKTQLEKRLSKRVKCLAWPVGWYNEALIEIAKDAGYEALFTAEDGANTEGGDVLRIKRAFVDGACDRTTFQRMLQEPKYHVCKIGGSPHKGIYLNNKYLKKIKKMLFNSYTFIFIFLPLTFLLFHSLRRTGFERSSILVLTLMSLVFYGWWNAKYLLLFVPLMFANFVVATSIAPCYRRRSPASKLLLMFGLAFNLAALGYFKYANFFVDNVTVSWVLISSLKRLSCRSGSLSSYSRKSLFSWTPTMARLNGLICSITHSL